MAKTAVADIIIPTEFEKYAIERTAELSAFGQCGIVQYDPAFDALAGAAASLNGKARSLNVEICLYSTNPVAGSNRRKRHEGTQWFQISRGFQSSR